MKVRDFIFWPHLVAGVLAGLIILVLGATGFLLMFERQISEWADTSGVTAPADGSAVLPLDELVARAAVNGISGTSVVVLPGAGSAVGIAEGRSRTWVNPWDGTPVPPNATADAFFGAVTGLHRWLGAGRENRDLPRSLVNLANLAFLFLAFTGIYLWLPRVWNRAMVKSRMFFRPGLSGKARDFNWHHAFAFWSLIPLVFIIYTGAMIHYAWARNLVLNIAGVEPQPQAEGGAERGRQGRGGADAATMPAPAAAAGLLSLDEIRDVAAGLESGWERLVIGLPGGSPTVSVQVDTGNGAQLHKQANYTLDRKAGTVVSVSTYADLPTERKIFAFQRFGHTGEAFGFIGQLIAGLASLASAFMAWTGLALAWRRLVSPLFRKAGARANASA